MLVKQKEVDVEGKTVLANKTGYENETILLGRKGRVTEMKVKTP